MFGDVVLVVVLCVFDVECVVMLLNDVYFSTCVMGGFDVVYVVCVCRNCVHHILCVVYLCVVCVHVNFVFCLV